MVHGDAWEGKWRGNWRMEWVAGTLTVVYPALLTLMRTPRLPAVDWTDAPADLNGLVRFGERRNLVSARVITFQTQSNTTMCTKAKNLAILKHVSQNTRFTQFLHIQPFRTERFYVWNSDGEGAMSHESSKFRVNIRRERLNRNNSSQNLVGWEAQFKLTFGTTDRTSSS